MPTVHVDQANFEAEVIRSTTPVVVDFWAEWCGPCKMIGPSLEQLSEEFAGRVKVAKLNVDESPALAAKYGVRSIPMLAIFKSGEVADVKIGALPKSELATWIGTSA